MSLFKPEVGDVDPNASCYHMLPDGRVAISIHRFVDGQLLIKCIRCLARFDERKKPAPVDDFLAKRGNPAHLGVRPRCNGCGANKWLPDGRCAYCKSGVDVKPPKFRDPNMFVPIRYSWPYPY